MKNEEMNLTIKVEGGELESRLTGRRDLVEIAIQKAMKGSPDLVSVLRDSLKKHYHDEAKEGDTDNALMWIQVHEDGISSQIIGRHINLTALIGASITETDGLLNVLQDSIDLVADESAGGDFKKNLNNLLN